MLKNYVSIINLHPKKKSKHQDRLLLYLEESIDCIEVPSNYSDCYQKIFEDLEYTDVELSIIDCEKNEKSFFGHKAIIASAIGFFDGLFSFNDQNEYVHETPLTISAFEWLFKYIYRRYENDYSLQIDDTDAIYLLFWIDYYQINDDEGDLVRFLRQRILSMKSKKLRQVIKKLPDEMINHIINTNLYIKKIDKIFKKVKDKEIIE